MIKKPYQTREFWIRELIEFNKPMQEICDEQGIGRATGYRWLAKLGIPKDLSELDEDGSTIEDMGIDIQAEATEQYEALKALAVKFHEEGDFKSELRARKFAADINKERLPARAKIGEPKKYVYTASKKDIETIRRLDAMLPQMEKEIAEIYNGEETFVEKACDAHPDIAVPEKPPKEDEDEE